MEPVTHDGVGSRVGAGFGYAVTAAISFGLSGAVARGLMDAGWSSGAAVALRMLLGAAVLVPLAAVALRGRWSLLRRNAGLVTTYGLVAVALCQFAYFNAVQHLQVGVALLLEYVAPVVVVGWMWLRHGERPSRLTVGGGALAAVGLLLVLDVLSGSGGVSLVGVAWGLLAMLGVVYFFVVSAREDNGLPGLVLAAGGLVVGGVTLGLLGLVGLVPWRTSDRAVSFASFDAPWWVCLLVLGVLSTSVPYVAGIEAGRRLGSRLASFAGLGEVLAALVFAWLLLAELPRPVQALGGVLLLAGVVVVKLGEPRNSPTVEPLPEPDLEVTVRPAA